MQATIRKRSVRGAMVSIFLETLFFCSGIRTSLKLYAQVMKRVFPATRRSTGVASLVIVLREGNIHGPSERSRPRPAREIDCIHFGPRSLILAMDVQSLIG